MPRIDMSGSGQKSWTWPGTDKERRPPTATPTATKAFIIHRLSGISIVAPYNAEFVDELKAQIPQFGRKWEAQSKSWWIDKLYVSEAQAIVRRYYSMAENVSDEQVVEDMRANIIYIHAQKTPPPRSAQPQHLQPTEANMRLYHADAATLEVWPTASLEVARAAYRAKAKQLHPDVSGRDTTAEMRTLNAAMAAWEARVRKNGGAT